MILQVNPPTPPRLVLPVVDHLDTVLFLALVSIDVPRIHPLPVDNLEAPSLIRDPLVADALHVRLHQLPFAFVQELAIPALLQIWLLEVLVVDVDEAATAPDLAKHRVGLLRKSPVQGSRLAVSLAGRGFLLNVDVHEAGCFVHVFFYVDGYCGPFDSLADQPADTLLWGWQRWLENMVMVFSSEQVTLGQR